jgi:hypothetical protein
MVLIDELNDLLASERGMVEAANALFDVVCREDTDLEQGLQDILDSARWACSALYHLLTQLDATPTLDIKDLLDRLDRERELPPRLKIFCREHEKMLRTSKRLLRHEDLSQQTRDTLEEIAGIHERGTRWLSEIIREWAPDTAA